MTIVTADEALKRLKQGNERFQKGVAENPGRDIARRLELAEGQNPTAIILCCSDSRVAPEFAFDAGLGDLFVVRVAGNVANTSSIGSIEYAVMHLGSKLVVVTGHESCGAVNAIMAAAQQGGDVEKNLDQPMAPFFYCASTMHCMTVSLAYDGAGLGAMWGEELAREMFSDAGFTNIDVRTIPGDRVNNYYICTK